jgi:two-component system response regulator MprA
LSAEPRTILIAERDQHVRDLQQHFLTRAGYRVEFADNGQAALERARSAKPALVIAEILIPKLDGLTLCRQLRDDLQTRHIPVVIFSILAAAARAKEAGAHAFLRKPIVEAVFVAAVESALSARSTVRQEQQWNTA